MAVDRKKAEKLLLGIIAVTQLLVAFVIQAHIVKVIGLGERTDVFYAAQTIPFVLSAVLIVTFQSYYFTALSIRTGKLRQWRCELGRAQYQVGLTFIIISLVLMSTSTYWMEIVFKGFSEEQLLKTKELFTYLMFSSWLSVHNYVFVLALRSKNQFLRADLLLTAVTIITLISLFFMLEVSNINSIGHAYLIANLIVMVVLYYLTGQPTYSFKRVLSTRRGVKSLLTVFYGSSLMKASPLVDRYWLSQSQPGMMTIFGIAQLINASLAKILEKVFVLPNIPELTRLVSKKCYFEIISVFRRTVLLLFLLSLGSVFIAYILMPVWLELISIVFGITSEKGEELLYVVIFLVGSMFASAAGSLLNSLFYAFGDPQTPTKVGVIGFLVSVPVRSLGFIYAGIDGLAIATSLYYLGNFSVLLFILNRKLGHVERNK